MLQLTPTVVTYLHKQLCIGISLASLGGLYLDNGLRLRVGPAPCYQVKYA